MTWPLWDGVGGGSPVRLHAALWQEVRRIGTCQHNRARMVVTLALNRRLGRRPEVLCGDPGATPLISEKKHPPRTIQNTYPKERFESVFGLRSCRERFGRPRRGSLALAR